MLNKQCCEVVVVQEICDFKVKRAQTKAAELHESVVPLAWRAGGGNCLGLRLKQRPASRVVIWRAKSVPFAWPESDLTSALKEAGWEEISVVAYPTRKIRPWLLRCKAPDSLDRVAGIGSGNVMTVLERAGPMGPTARNFKKLGVQPRVAKRAVQLFLNLLILNRMRSTSLTPRLWTLRCLKMRIKVWELRFRKEVSNVLEQLPRPNLCARKKKLDPAQRFFSWFPLINLDCGADGSRGLTCIAVGTAIMRGGKFKDLEPKKATMGATLRVQVATHIAKSEKDYKPLWPADVSTASVAREDGDIPTTWESWLHCYPTPSALDSWIDNKAGSDPAWNQNHCCLEGSRWQLGSPIAFGTYQKKKKPWARRGSWPLYFVGG